MNNEPDNSKSKTSETLYLDQLEFKKKDAKTFLNFFLTNQKVILLMIMAILIWGIVSFNALPLESSPEVKIPIGMVTVSLPGASPADVEELVIKKIETKIANLSGVKTITSTALNSFGTISVEFRAEEDLNDAIRRLRDGVATAKADLPADATDPVVTQVSLSNAPVWTMVLTGPYDSFALRKYADDVKAELDKLPGASNVTISGGDIAEYRVSFNPDKLNQFGLSMDQVLAVVRSNNITLPLGSIAVSNFEYSLRLEGKFHTAQELRDLPISGSADTIIRLKDVANVSERAQDRKTITRFSIGGAAPQNAISISVVKKTGSSIIELVDSGKAALAKLQKDTLPPDLKIESTYDVSKKIRTDFDNLSHEAMSTILLVIVILFLFVGLKEAFTAGIVIPLVFAASFGFMLLFGQTLNFLSLFSLILSLGLLVDDAIVVVQATKQYMATGKFTPEQAVLLVFKDFFAIILTTSLTTIFAFLPLVLATGIIGQFIRSIPITVSITLAASTVIAIVINHPMAAILERFKITKGFARLLFALILLAFFASLYFAFTTASVLIIIVSALLFCAVLTAILLYRRSLKAKFEANEQAILEERAFPEKIKARLRHHYGENEEKSWLVKVTSGIVKLDRILPTYERVLNFFLNSKLNSALLIVVIIIVFASAVALPVTGILKSEFLPSADSELIYVNIEGAPGLVLDQTKKVADQVEAVLLQESNIKNFSEVIGSPGVSTSGALGGASTNQTNIAQFAINLKPLEERVNKQKSYDYAPVLRKKVEAIQGAKVTLVVQSGGPPSGGDFEVRFTGDDLIVLEHLANQYKDLLSAIPGTVNESTSLKLSSGEFTFKLKPAEMQTRGITPAQIAGTLRTAISGSEITKVLSGQDEIRVEAEYNPDSVATIDQLQSLTLTNAKGQKFPLSEVADLSLGSSLSSISRINQKRVVVLSASVEKPALPGDVLTQFQKILVDHPLPQGYEAIFGGQNDTNTESILSIIRAMSVAFILIISLLVIQFNSFRKAILVLLTIPLALAGVLFGLTLIHFTLSFPTLIGILALFGIVVKNAVILIDKININLRVGIPFKSAITDASKSRLEAIFLTTVATIIGMIPITLYDETWEGLGAALIFGLAASTVLTLILIPTVFNLLFAKDAERDEKLRELKKQAAQKT